MTGDVLGQLGLAFGALRDPSYTPLLVGRCSYSFLHNLGLTMTNGRHFEKAVNLYGAFCSFGYFVTLRKDELKWPAVLSR